MQALQSQPMLVSFWAFRQAKAGLSHRQVVPVPECTTHEMNKIVQRLFAEYGRNGGSVLIGAKTLKRTQRLCVE